MKVLRDKVSGEMFVKMNPDDKHVISLFDQKIYGVNESQLEEVDVKPKNPTLKLIGDWIMAKATILKTNIGIMVIGNIQCSNDGWFDAEGCYRYCNEDEKSSVFNKLQSDKLIYNSALLSKEPKAPNDWYKYRENFIDIEIAFECNQSYNFKDNKNKC